MKCHEEREKEFLRKALKEEKSYIPKLKIKYGKYQKHYALPHDFGRTLFHERDFCPYCGIKLEIQSYNEKKLRYETVSHIDHMDPLELGGEDSIRNIIFCCSSCNAKKGSKPFLSWLKQLKPKYRKLVREIYTAKHGHPPEKFIERTPVLRTNGLSYDLTLDEDELKEMYTKPIVDGPPEKDIIITISLDLQKPLKMKNANNKR